MPLSEDIVLKLVLSVIIGGLVGAEREFRSKSAGIRTIMLICLGSTVFTILSSLIGARGAPERIASNIVVGIGFVGAGVIFKSETGVNGITTAAAIWVSAALGMAIGAGYPWIAVFASLLALLVLFAFTALQGWIDRVNQFHSYKIVCDFENETLERYEKLFGLHHLKFKRIRQTKSGLSITGLWIVQGSEKNHQQFIRAILDDPSVRAFEF
jgi:putative Mg2+ transporter-C (MgtC) family protein